MFLLKVCWNKTWGERIDNLVKLGTILAELKNILNASLYVLSGKSRGSSLRKIK